MTQAVLNSSSFDLAHSVKSSFHSLLDIWGNLRARVLNKEKVRHEITGVLENYAELESFFPTITYLFEYEEHSRDALQAQINILWVIKDLTFHATMLKQRFSNTKLLVGTQYKSLSKTITAYSAASKKLHTILVKKMDFSQKNPIFINKVDRYSLNTPFTACIEDDDTGKHVSVFELPQIYAFGETEDEAFAMLDREILSLYQDLQEEIPFSAEFELVKDLLNMAFYEK